MFVKDKNKLKRGRGWPIFFKKNYATNTICFKRKLVQQTGSEIYKKVRKWGGGSDDQFVTQDTFPNG